MNDDPATAVRLAATELRNVVGTSRCAISWSGGKDSIALQVVMQAAGFGEVGGVCGVASALEIPAALAWYRDHRPVGVEMIDRPDYDLAWLAANPRYLFPTSGAELQVFTDGVTRWAQQRYVRQVRPDILVNGRRRADGNWFPNTLLGTHTAHGATWYSPIRAWSNDLTMAVIAWTNAPLPPVYDWKHGMKTGTGPWPGWRLGREVGTAYLNAVDPDVLQRAREAGVPL